MDVHQARADHSNDSTVRRGTIDATFREPVTSRPAAVQLRARAPAARGGRAGRRARRDFAERPLRPAHRLGPGRRRDTGHPVLRRDVSGWQYAVAYEAVSTRKTLPDDSV